MTTMSRPINRTEAQPQLGGGRRAGDEQNMGTTDRVLAGAVGGWLTLRALRRPSLTRLALAALGGHLAYRAATGHSMTYAALGIDTAHQGNAHPGDFFDHGIHIEASVTIDKPADELYRFWRNFENLPRFMRHLEAVRTLDAGRSHWRAKAPAGTTVQWAAQIINEEENRLIAWRSLEDADVDNAGSVRFISAPGGRGTEVRVVVEYIPPGGRIGSAIARIFGEEPRQQIADDLRRFKQIMETGEVVSIEGQPMGCCCEREE